MNVAKTVYSDGTFSIVPKLFQQLYTLHVEVQDMVVPVVYFLLPNKRESTYRMAFSKFKKLCPDFQPDEIMTDFEIAATNAYDSLFPLAHLKGCFFHLSQAIYRKIQKIPEVNSHYRSDPVYARNLKMIPALAFLPPEDVEYGFETLEHCDLYEKHAEFLADLLNYFEIHNIGRLHGSQRREPRYAIRYGMFVIYYMLCVETLFAIMNSFLDFGTSITIP